MSVIRGREFRRSPTRWAASFSFITITTILLTAVTAPGINGGAPRVLVRLHYHQMNLNWQFFGSDHACAGNNAPFVLDAIYYPATNSGYWFNDS